MKIPRLRFTIRWLMIAVAIVALATWHAVRRTQYLELAKYYERRAAIILNGSSLMGMKGRDKFGRPTTDWESAMHYELGVRYRRASLYPWMPIEPDPDPVAYEVSFREEVLEGFLKSDDFSSSINDGPRTEEPKSMTDHAISSNPNHN